jgi:hypothetical protein
MVTGYHHQINIFSEKTVTQISGDADKSGEVDGPFLLLDPWGFQESNIVDHPEYIEQCSLQILSMTLPPS